MFSLLVALQKGHGLFPAACWPPWVQQSHLRFCQPNRLSSHFISLSLLCHPDPGEAREH